MAEQEKLQYIKQIKDEIAMMPARDYDQKHEELVLLHKSQ